MDMERRMKSKGIPFTKRNILVESGLDKDPLYLEYKKKCNEYRSFKDKKENIIISTLSSKGTSDDESEVYTKDIVIDIDGIDEVDNLFNKMTANPFIKFMFISPGGNGIKVVFESNIPDGEYDIKLIKEFHAFTYTNIVHQLNNDYKIEVDTSGSNISRRCILSKGRKFYYNEDYCVVESWDGFNKRTIKKSKSVKVSHNIQGINKPLYEKAISFFADNGIDAFSDYKDWVKLSFLVYKNFKDSGLIIFDKLSQFSSNYDPSAVSKLWGYVSKNYNESRVGSDKWLLKKMIDNGFVVKSTDNLMKRYIWDESDYERMKKEMGFDIIRDVVSGNLYISRDGQIDILDDLILNQVITDMRLTYNTKLKDTTLKSYMFSDNFVTKRNFIKEKFDEIITDDPTEFDKIFLYLKAKEGDDLTKRVLNRWMLGCVKNLLHSFYDEMICFKGEQGMGKSTWIIQYLLKPFERWTSSSFNWDDGSTDQIRQLIENLFIYDSENLSLTKSESSKIKSITSKQTISFRLPYDKFPRQYRRISNFIMDTNEEHVFNDLTGGRRYLILNLKSLNIYDKDGGELKKIDYNKVWGYIYHQYTVLNIDTNSINIEDIYKSREDSRLKSDLEHYIDHLFVSDDNNMMTYQEIKDIITAEYLKIGKMYRDDEYNITKVGRILSKFKSKQVRDGQRTMKKYFIRPISEEISVSSEDKYVDSILDRIAKEGGEPSEKEKEILKKLRGNGNRI